MHLLRPFTHLLTTLLLSPLLTLTLAAPSPQTRRSLNENSPWLLQDVTIFSARTGYGVSYVTFTFNDSNSGLDLVTTCNRFILPSSGGNVVDGSNYYECDNSTVAWQYDGTKFTVQRSYLDPSIGSYPYDEVVAFGNAATNNSGTQHLCGRAYTWTSISVPITSEIA